MKKKELEFGLIIMTMMALCLQPQWLARLKNLTIKI